MAVSCQRLLPKLRRIERAAENIAWSADPLCGTLNLMDTLGFTTMPGTEMASPTAQTKSLPSSDAASAFLEGAPGGGFALVTSTALRSVLIAPGLIAVGIPWKKALLGALVSSISITTFILIYMSAKKANQRRALRNNPRGGSIARKNPNLLQGAKALEARRERQVFRAGRRAAIVRGL